MQLEFRIRLFVNDCQSFGSHLFIIVMNLPDVIKSREPYDPLVSKLLYVASVRGCVPRKILNLHLLSHRARGIDREILAVFDGFDIAVFADDHVFTPHDIRRGIFNFNLVTFDGADLQQIVSSAPEPEPSASGTQFYRQSSAADAADSASSADVDLNGLGVHQPRYVAAAADDDALRLHIICPNRTGRFDGARFDASVNSCRTGARD